MIQYHISFFNNGKKIGGASSFIVFNYFHSQIRYALSFMNITNEGFRTIPTGTSSQALEKDLSVQCCGKLKGILQKQSNVVS